MYRRLLSYLRPHRARFAAAMGCMAVFSGLTGATMWLIRTIFDKIFVMKDLHTLYIVTILIPVFFVIKGLAGYGQNYLLSYIAQNVVRTIRNDLYGRMLTLSHDFYVRTTSARLLARVTNDVNALQNALFRVPPSIIRDGLTVLIMIGVLIYLNARFAMITLVIFPLASLPIVQFARKMRSASRDGQHQMAELFSLTQESLGNIGVIKAYLREQSEVARFKSANDAYYETQQKFIRVDARSSPIMELIGSLAVAFVLWYGGRDVINGVWTAGSFLAFLTAAFSLYQPVKNFSQTNSLIQQAMAGTERIFEVMDEHPSVVEKPGALVLKGFSREIRFENVGFSYRDDARALQDIDLSVKPGEVIALVGPSGSGKTTMAALLVRFYDATQGRITIDGHDIRDLSIDSLRGCIGIVPQDIMLFNETIRYNIAYGRHDATDDDVCAAAQAANAHRFIDRLPQGYDTMVGERGVTLSGGERQRIAIARAVVKNPPVLLLDEATSALDTESEQLVQEAIERLMRERTVIMIAHRLATVRRADRIVVLDRGRIVEQGPHDELLRREGVYHRLHTLQLM